MDYTIKGRVRDEQGTFVSNAVIKAYDNSGELVSTVQTDEKGLFETKIDAIPEKLKIARKGKILTEKKIMPGYVVDDVIDIGYIPICIITPDWHIKGIVKDKMTGDPLPNLTVEAWDYDPSGPYNDYLGSQITDNNGNFSIWFDEIDFERTGLSSTTESYPDVILKVKNPKAKGITIHETDVDWDVSGVPHDCLKGYCAHKGKNYTIEVDYITALINSIGPVTTTDIDNTGLASYERNKGKPKVPGCPFGRNTTVGGRIWGSKLAQWRLSYASGVVDSDDPKFSNLLPSNQDPWKTIAQGHNKVWDGSIAKWNTLGINGLHTLILVVWDQNGVEYHDTQIITLNNTKISPPATISTPTSCTVLSKSSTPIVTISGTASDDYFSNYQLMWAGNDSNTELVKTGITLASNGEKLVKAGTLGTWDISNLKNCAYVIRLEVHDKTILDDGAHVHDDWTWVTVNVQD